MYVERLKVRKSFLETISLWNYLSKECDTHNMMLGIALKWLVK